MVRNCAPENLEIPGPVLSDRPGMTANGYLFKKFSGSPGRGQSMAINSPLPDSVM
jgi:hypothetical protein